MPIFRLKENELSFPHPSLANQEGILAIGGDLSTDRLLLAYEYGIFPWYNEGEPILWWSPDPRFVLFPENLKVSKSMRPYFNQKKFSVTYDQAFSFVIKSCAEVSRDGQRGTWITSEIQEAYTHLHELGYAHSVEVWEGNDIVGGLYGISIGAVFFGESMFTTKSNASKFGFIHLVRDLKSQGYQLIDCQQQTRHLGSLGAQTITRAHFMELLKKWTLMPSKIGNWQRLLKQT